MILIYNLGLKIYLLAIKIASLFNEKAAMWIKGRRDQQYNKNKWKNEIKKPLVWFHCASTGEYEQGKPLMKKIKEKYPACHLLVTFFSPSGFEAKKNDPLIDKVLYLPLDQPKKSLEFVHQINPSMVFFVKYEFWYYYFKSLKLNNIPFYIISANFRKDQLFFKPWLGSFFKNILKAPTHIFVQTIQSKELLKSIGVTSVTVAGDTRLEQVLEVKNTPFSDHIIESFIKGPQKIFIAGSTWLEDEKMIINNLPQIPDVKYMIVPHEINNTQIHTWKQIFKEDCAIYSQVSVNDILSTKKILIVDKMGMLSKIYRYADIAYIGGGFGKGIHNILEAAVYGIPVIFGPNYKKFNEAFTLLNERTVISIQHASEFSEKLREILVNYTLYKHKIQVSQFFSKENTAATSIILNKIEPSFSAQ